MKNKISIICTGIFYLVGIVHAQVPENRREVTYSFNKMPEVLPGTKLLSQGGDQSAKMLDGAHKFIEEKISQSIVNRLKLWSRDFSSKEAYEKSVEPNRKRLMKCIGVEDKN